MEEGLTDFDFDFKAFLRRHPDFCWKTTAVLLRCGTPTRTGRIYPRELMERELARYVATQQNIGHVNNEPDDLAGATFVVNNVRLVRDEIKAEVKFLGTHSGLKVQKLVEAGLKVSYSFEGVGSTDEFGVVQDDYRITGVVVAPEVPDWESGCEEPPLA